MQVYIAIDIEKGERLLSSPIVSIGYCVGDENGNVLSKNKINFKVEWPTENSLGDFDRRCWDDFWSKQPKETIELLKKDAVDFDTGISLFSDILDDIEKKYEKISFLSDNPSFDISSIDYCLEKYLGRYPMRYDSKLQYRNVISEDDLFYSLSLNVQERILKESVEPFVSHDHDPSNDAEYIYRRYIGYLKQK